MESVGVMLNKERESTFQSILWQHSVFKDGYFIQLHVVNLCVAVGILTLICN